MAKNNQPLFVRSKLLPNNSAAEFVELRTSRFFGPEFPSPNGIEFAPDVDMFVARDVASSMKSVQTRFLNEIFQVFLAHLLIPVFSFENYFQASRDKCKEFEVLLIDFAKLIYDRNFEKKFQVKSKSFQEYKIQDVLEIAEKVQMKHGSISKVREHTAVFRKCFAAVGRNQGAVDNLLNFIPNDSYGSIIFGGFTLILTVGVFTRHIYYILPVLLTAS